MKLRHAIVAVAALCAALVLVPAPAGAHGPGFVMRAKVGLFNYVPRFQFRTPRPLQFRPTRNRHAFRPWPWPRPWYGGVRVLQAEQPVSVTQPTQPVPVKSCRYLKQAVTVPAEAGGSTQVTVTRC